MPYSMYDHIEVRCPSLGGEVVFGYCRQLNNGLPCSRVLTCYQNTPYPIETFFRICLKEETFNHIFFSRDEDRFDRLLRITTEAKERVS